MSFEIKVEFCNFVKFKTSHFIAFLCSSSVFTTLRSVCVGGGEGPGLHQDSLCTVL